MWRYALVVAAAGCGGGEDDDDGALPGTDGDTAAVDTWDPSWIALEDGVLARVNQARGAGGRCGDDYFPPSAPLVHDPLLRDVARAHSRNMATRGFFDHRDPQGKDPFDRMEDAGFTGAQPWGENIAAGLADANGVVEQWLGSVGHCRNIREPSYGAIGIGYFSRPDDPQRLMHYWTQNFAGSPQP
jgi:uncharacterized protein YkwD